MQAECLNRLKRNESKSGDAVRWTGGPKGRECGMHLSQLNRPAALTIRDSRIAISRWLSERSLITFGIRGSQPVRFHGDYERGAIGIISRKARRR